MTNEKPKGIAFYLGRSLQAIGAMICFLAMFEFVNLFGESSKHFGDFTNFEERVRDQGSKSASILRQFLIGTAIVGVGSAITYERDIATRVGETTINAKKHY